MDEELAAMLRQIMGDDAPSMTAPPATPQTLQPVVTEAVFTDTASRGDALPPLVLPVFTSEEIASTIDMRNYATMIRLRMRKWTARAKDSRVARGAAKAEGATEQAFSVYKKLLAGADEKRAKVASIIDSARMRHYEMTLPWSTTGVDESGRRDGPRLLPNTLYMDYISVMAEAKRDMRIALDEFKTAYPTLIESARHALGTAFDETEYPTVESLDERFALDYDVSPIPTGVDFKGLPQQQIDALKVKMDDTIRTCLENAMQDVWSRLHTAVSKMAERLSDPEKTFHDTLVGNVREVVQLGEHLNATKNPKLSALLQRAREELCAIEPEALRKSVSLRERVANDATDILRQMARHGV